MQTVFVLLFVTRLMICGFFDLIDSTHSIDSTGQAVFSPIASKAGSGLGCLRSIPQWGVNGYGMGLSALKPNRTCTAYAFAEFGREMPIVVGACRVLNSEVGTKLGSGAYGVGRCG